MKIKSKAKSRFNFTYSFFGQFKPDSVYESVSGRKFCFIDGEGIYEKLSQGFSLLSTNFDDEPKFYSSLTENGEEVIFFYNDEGFLFIKGQTSSFVASGVKGVCIYKDFAVLLTGNALNFYALNDLINQKFSVNLSNKEGKILKLLSSDNFIFAVCERGSCLIKGNLDDIYNSNITFDKKNINESNAAEDYGRIFYASNSGVYEVTATGERLIKNFPFSFTPLKTEAFFGNIAVYGKDLKENYYFFILDAESGEYQIKETIKGAKFSKNFGYDSCSYFEMCKESVENTEVKSGALTFGTAKNKVITKISVLGTDKAVITVKGDKEKSVTANENESVNFTLTGKVYEFTIKYEKGEFKGVNIEYYVQEK